MSVPQTDSQRFYLFAMMLHARTTGLYSGRPLCDKEQGEAHERAVKALIDADEALRVFESHPAPIFPEMEPSA